MSEVGDAIRELAHVVRTEEDIEGIALQVDDLWNRAQAHRERVTAADETDTTSEVARVLADHTDGAIRMDAWVCAACGAPLAMLSWNAMVEGTTGPLLRKAMAAHQAAMLAEAGLLRGRAWVDELNAAHAEVEQVRTAHATDLGNLGQSIILLVQRIGAVRALAESWMNAQTLNRAAMTRGELRARKVPGPEDFLAAIDGPRLVPATGGVIRNWRDLGTEPDPREHIIILNPKEPR